MKFFVDTADVKEIKELAESGFIDGVTTNPSLIAKTGRKIEDVIAEICNILPNCPISAEVIALEAVEMIKEGLLLSKISKDVVVKLPLTLDGLKACRTLTEKDIKTNVTLCFSPSQALLAAKAGATYISPFVGRLDDISHDGVEIIDEICTIYANYEYETQVLVASIRNPNHLIRSALLGAHVATIPPSIFKQLLSHPLTDIGLAKFMEDAKK